MGNARIRSFALVATFALGLGSEARTAAADGPGDLALGLVDDTLDPRTTLVLELRATTSPTTPAVGAAPQPEPRKATLTLSIEGDKRLLVATAPADVQGTKLVVVGPDQTFIHEPVPGKLRRITASLTDPGIMG